MLMRQGVRERNAAASAPTTAAAPATAATAAPSASVAVNPTPAAALPPGVAVTTTGTPQVATVTVTVPTTMAPGTVLAPGQAAPPAASPGVVAPSNAPPLIEEPVLSSQNEPIAPDFDPADYTPAAAPSAPRNTGNSLPTRDDVVTSGGPAIPAMRLDLHVYANNPAERFVFVNMRKLREGESLADGTRVETITPTGAVLSYRGTRFTLQSE
jgi:general secretion pathway protein B